MIPDWSALQHDSKIGSVSLIVEVAPFADMILAWCTRISESECLNDEIAQFAFVIPSVRFESEVRIECMVSTGLDYVAVPVPAP